MDHIKRSQFTRIALTMFALRNDPLIKYLVKREEKREREKRIKELEKEALGGW